MPGKLFIKSILLLLFFSTICMAEPSIKVTHAQIMLMPPTIKITAGFMRIENAGNNDVVIAKITAKNFERIEIHKSEINNGIAQMMPQESLLIPAGSAIVLAHGSYHLMMHNPDRKFTEGEWLQLRLHTNEGEFSISAQVTKIQM